MRINEHFQVFEIADSKFKARFEKFKISDSECRQNIFEKRLVSRKTWYLGVIGITNFEYDFIFQTFKIDQNAD